MGRSFRLWTAISTRRSSSARSSADVNAPTPSDAMGASGLASPAEAARALLWGLGAVGLSPATNGG
jgi:hypothetical protein